MTWFEFTSLSLHALVTLAVLANNVITIIHNRKMKTEMTAIRGMVRTYSMDASKGVKSETIHRNPDRNP